MWQKSSEKLKGKKSHNKLLNKDLVEDFFHHELTPGIIYVDLFNKK